MNPASDAIITTVTPDVSDIAAQNPASNQNAVENQTITRRGGLWSQPNVPHTGWTCTGGEDLMERTEICNMCLRQRVRYIHVMRHPDYPRELRVGCVCSASMEGDPAAAQAREKRMLSRAGRRKRLLSRRWRISAAGNQYITTVGNRITVWPRNGGLAYTVAAVDGSRVYHSQQTFQTLREAQLNAIDVLMGVAA